MYDAPSPFVWNDAAFRGPEVDDHVVYEMNAKPRLSVSARPTRGSQYEWLQIMGRYIAAHRKNSLPRAFVTFAVRPEDFRW
jgi:hypothetical protein